MIKIAYRFTILLSRLFQPVLRVQQSREWFKLQDVISLPAQQMFALAVNLCSISSNNFMISCFLLTWVLPLPPQYFFLLFARFKYILQRCVDYTATNSMSECSSIIWRIYDDAHDECFLLHILNIYSFESFTVSAALSTQFLLLPICNPEWFVYPTCAIIKQKARREGWRIDLCTRICNIFFPSTSHTF